MMTSLFALLATEITWVDTLHQTMMSLISDKGDVFLGFGLNVAYSLATIAVVLFGARTALSGEGLNWNAFLSLVLKVCTILALLRGYQQEYAVFGGRNLPDLVTSGGQEFARQIGGKSFDQIDDKIDEILKNNPPSVGLDISMTALQGFVYLLLQVFRACLWIVMSWGYIGQGVCILVGPILIPFALFPPLSWMCWNWIRTFLYFSFYPVVAAAVTHVFAVFLMNFMFSGNTTVAAMVGLIPFLLVCTAGLIRVPGLVGQFFSGGGGGGGGGAALQAIGAKFGLR